MREILSVKRKALAINLDKQKYGTFAEIGAGQEVVRHFFQAGGAAGTVAKSMSAYDMTFSDAIYGCENNKRYVSETRLRHMLDHEYALIEERLQHKRAEDTTLFVFANTVTTKSFHHNNECHGWLGLRYQTPTCNTPNDVILHIRLLDDNYLLQQEVVGIIGVNLIYAIFYYLDSPNILIESLMDNLTLHRLEVDILEFSGPQFQHINNRLVSLQLVKQGLSQAVMFDANGKIRQPADVLHKNPCLIQRGIFRPVTHHHMDIQKCAIGQFLKEPNVKNKKPVILLELSLNNLTHDGQIAEQDFLDRIDLLCSLGNNVLLSNFNNYYELANFINHYCKTTYAIVLQPTNLQDILEEKNYQSLPGGILEAFSKLFSQNGKIYVYPQYDEQTKQLLTTNNININPNLNYLYKYLLANNLIMDLTECDISKVTIHCANVLRMIQTGEAGWEQFVPAKVATIIKEMKLWQPASPKK